MTVTNRPQRRTDHSICLSYRTKYSERLIYGECDCGWVSELLPTHKEVLASWSRHVDRR